MEINLGLFSLTFITDETAIGTPYQANYSLILIFVSYLFAFAGSYVGLLTSEQVKFARNRAEAVAWLIAGATSMGAGVWSMHFVGMVAYELPMVVHYSILLTGLSILPSIGASFLALLTLSRQQVRIVQLGLSSLFMGAGIGAMHFTGMAAMHADAAMGYDPVLFAVSIGVAVFFAYVALTAKASLAHRMGGQTARWINPISSAIMAIAISAMHYTAMSAVRFYPGHHSTSHSLDVDIGFLLVLINALVFLLIFLVFTAILARKTYANTALKSALEKQKKLESKLEKNLQIFQSTVENFPGGICLVDKNLILTVANQGYYDALRIDRDAFPAGSSLESMIRLFAERGEYGRGEPQKVVAERMDQARLFEAMKFDRLRPTDGRTIEFSRAPLPGGGFVQSVIDVTDIRKAEEDRVTREREASQAQKMESLGTLASGVAHEINTPIQYVGDNIRFSQEGIADLLELLDGYRTAYQAEGIGAEQDALAKREVEIDLDFLRGELPQSLAQSLEGIDQVALIVNAIKEFSHPGQDEMSAVDLNSAINTTLTVSRAQWKYVAEIETDLMPDLPLVQCYQGDISQVILNMIVNAAHAIEDSDHGEPGRIGISTSHEGGVVEINISDNGAGMPDDVRQRIFDPFYTTKDVGKGTGQGLAIAYAIIHQKHGGTIACSSEVGIGTRFTIRLPVDGHQTKDELAA